MRATQKPNGNVILTVVKKKNYSNYIKMTTFWYTSTKTSPEPTTELSVCTHPIKIQLDLV